MRKGYLAHIQRKVVVRDDAVMASTWSTFMILYKHRIKQQRVLYYVLKAAK
jgi:hypothetical protein